MVLCAFNVGQHRLSLPMVFTSVSKIHTPVQLSNTAFRIADSTQKIKDTQKCSIYNISVQKQNSPWLGERFHISADQSILTPESFPSPGGKKEKLKNLPGALPQSTQLIHLCSKTRATDSLMLAHRLVQQQLVRNSLSSE